MMEQIAGCLLEKDLSLTNVTQIWLTHHDHDHVGSLADINSKYLEIMIKARKPEIDYIEGTENSLRLRQAVEQQASLPPEAQSKFAPGTSQHSLQENRIYTLRVAQALVSQQPDDFTHADLERAKAPLASANRNLLPQFSRRSC